VKYQLAMKSPEWAKGKTLTGANSITPESVTLAVHP
jgi:hypothetical protein